MLNFKNLLFVPATTNKLKRITEIKNDVFIFDLEDSILAEDKKNALIRLVNFLSETKILNTQIIVRVNLEYIFDEIELLKNRVDGFLIPKVEDTEILEKIKKYLPNKFIIALIETPKGIINLEKIVASDSVHGIAFGAEDFTSSTNIENIEENLSLIKMKIVLYSKAYNKQVFDTPSFETRDLERLEKEIIKTKSLGFDGKLLIHPKQIEVMNKVYDYNYQEIKEIIKKFEENNSGILCFNGKIYEIAHIKRLKRILEGEKK